MSDDLDALLAQERVGKLIRYIALATWRADGWLYDDFDEKGMTHRWGAQEFVVHGMTAPVREALARAVSERDTALDVIAWLEDMVYAYQDDAGPPNISRPAIDHYCTDEWKATFAAARSRQAVLAAAETHHPDTT